MRFFVPLLKVEDGDDGTLKVSGIASSEAKDRSDETITADAMRKALPDFFAHGTGNLREMHQLNAAGTVDEASVDEDTNKTLISTTVVDPIAVLKVRTGVYKGFSVGGRVLERDPKNRKIITKISLNEISLVDRPANPEAVIDLWKADGVQPGMIESPEAALTKIKIDSRHDLKTALRSYARNSDPLIKAHIIERATSLQAEDFLPEGWRTTEKADDMSQKQADALGKTVTPAATNFHNPAPSGQEHVQHAPVAAAAAFAKADAVLVGMAESAASVAAAGAVAAPTAEDIAKAAAADAALAKPEPPAAPAAPVVAEPAQAAIDPVAKAEASIAALETAVSGAQSLAKGMYAVSSFADVLQSIAYLASSAEYEAEMEGDNSLIPAKLRAWLANGAEVFKEMAKEEIDELVAMVNTKKADAAGAIAKADAIGDDELAKAVAERDGLAKSLAEREETLAKMSERIDPLTKAVESMAARLAEIEKQPLPPKTAGAGLAKAAVAVGKEQDNTSNAAGRSPAAGPALSVDEIRKALDNMTEEERGLALIKAAHTQPRHITR
jgi:hypothetical protein